MVDSQIEDNDEKGISIVSGIASWTGKSCNNSVKSSSESVEISESLCF